MGSLWVYRYRPMRAFLTTSTTIFIGVPFVCVDISGTRKGGQQQKLEKVSQTGSLSQLSFWFRQARRSLRLICARVDVASRIKCAIVNTPISTMA